MTDSASSAVPMLRAHGLRCAVAGRTLWEGLDCAFPAGVSWIAGGEGRGKTALLRMLAGELPAPGSRIELLGCSLQSQPASYRQQVFWLDPHTTAWDQMPAQAFWAEQAARWPRWNAATLSALVQALALEEHQHKPLYMLSTGSRRKVWLCAAAASGAPVTLLDEPFAALDRASIRVCLQWLHAAAAAPERAWVVAAYVPPEGVPLALIVNLGD